MGFQSVRDQSHEFKSNQGIDELLALSPHIVFKPEEKTDHQHGCASEEDESSHAAFATCVCRWAWVEGKAEEEAEDGTSEMPKDVRVAGHQNHHDQHEDDHAHEATSHLFELWVSTELVPVENDHGQLSGDQSADSG